MVHGTRTILLFKIELNPKIEPIQKRELGPIQYEPFDPFVHESNRETSTCECFADDNSTFTLLCFNSLTELKKTWKISVKFRDYPVTWKKPS